MACVPGKAPVLEVPGGEEGQAVLSPSMRGHGWESGRPTLGSLLRHSLAVWA